jgi:hypothetical protein
MSEMLDALINLDVAADLPSIPMINLSVINACFNSNKGVITSKPEYVVTANSYGKGNIVLPPGSLIRCLDLLQLRENVLADLENSGFALGRKLSTNDKARWDKELGASLFKNLEIPLHQIGDPSVWAYLTLFVFWDLPTWRFPKAEEKDELDLVNAPEAKSSKNPYLRSAGGPRNVLRKCWDRAYILGPELGTEGHAATVQGLGEDELVNIFERTTIGNNRKLASAIVETVLLKHPIRSQRMDVVRRFTKAVLRKTPTTHFVSLEKQLLPALSDIYDSVMP